MSQENVELVRKPLSVRQQSSRTLDQRLGLRFPGLLAANGRLIARLPPTSRIRQSLLGRAARLGCEAFNRRDLDALLLGIDPDCEIQPPHELVEAGLVDASYRGPAGYRELLSSWSEVWGAGARLEPLELIDLGERVVVLSNMPARAQASGVPLNEPFATVSTMKDGSVISQRQYRDHAQALEAVGLRE
jgi:ketosteroid isomerase-like protein